MASVILDDKSNKIFQLGFNTYKTDVIYFFFLQ